MAASYYNAGSLSRDSLLALIWTCFGTSFLFVTVRTGIRLRVSPRLTADDCFVLLALTTLLTLCVMETVQLDSLYYMTGVIAGVVPPSGQLIPKTEEYLRLQFPVTILFWTVLWCVKAGFLALYFKLFKELEAYRRLWYALAAFTFLAYAGCIIGLALSCGPISNFFEFGKCGTDQNVWASNFSVYFSTAVDVATDLFIMAMPLRLIYGIKISLKQKAGLASLFGLCFVMITFAIIRAKQVLVPKYFVNLVLLVMWSTLAASISVIVGSLPAFKLLFNSHASSKRSRHGSSNGARKEQGSANTSALRNKSIRLGSFSSDKKSGIGNNLEAGDSREEILRDGARFVLVQHDVSVSHDRPQRTYQPSHPGRLQTHQSGFAF